uniref:(northern house mosquito) hypothetical protein n=1 Tax=Culex pipiens TaxID=7175 RepID=A0A8D8I470_CULPI
MVMLRSWGNLSQNLSLRPGLLPTASRQRWQVRRATIRSLRGRLRKIFCQISGGSLISILGCLGCIPESVKSFLLGMAADLTLFRNLILYYKITISLTKINTNCALPKQQIKTN